LAAHDEYADLGIDFRPGRRVSSISTLSYEHLVLATGVRARTLDVPGLPLAGVHTLRTVGDADQLRQQLDAAVDVVVIGAGFIGLEFATGAVRQARRVTVLEAAPRILARSLSGGTAAFLHTRHAENGVRIRTNVAVAGLTGRAGRVAGVQLTDGSVIPADLVVVGIGVVPNDDLAVEAGLAVDRNGIVVDEFLRTSDPSVYAIGDVASFANRFAHQRTRVESVQNAMDQARCLAATLSGAPCAYQDLPWFWSQQAGHLVQIAGIGQGYDTAQIHQSVDPMSFSTFCYRDGRLVAVESIDQPRIHMKARRELRSPIG
jgi:3-phenylpropionate/trans-cinnamate dioxygenase ferredoxin reductase subunit